MQTHPTLVDTRHVQMWNVNRLKLTERERLTGLSFFFFFFFFFLFFYCFFFFFFYSFFFFKFFLLIKHVAPCSISSIGLKYLAKP